MLYKDTNQIKRNYYLNLFSANAEIVKNGNNNFMYEWNIRDLQLGKYAEIALIQLASINADYTEERQYPPKLYNEFSATSSSSNDIFNIAPVPYYKQTIKLNTDDITYGSGTYEIYSSSSLVNDSSTRKSSLFDYRLFNNELGASWASGQYTNEYYTGSRFIKNDYTGDWIILKLPSPIILTKFRFYNRNIIDRAPSLWRCYGSNDGITFTEIIEASNDIIENALNASTYSSGFYEKILTTFTTSYSYIGFTFKKIVSSSANALNFIELQIFGREKLNIMNPIMWYKFDASSTNMLLDSSGNNYNLTNSGATFDGTNFKRGYGSVAFNHTTQQHLIIPSINLYNIQSKKGITFSLWVRMNTNTGNNARIFDFNIGGTRKWVVIARAGTLNKIFFNIDNSTIPSGSITTTNDYVDGNWHHIIWSINNVGRWTIYIDGVIATFQQTLPTNTNIENITFSNNFFGRSLFPTDGYYNGNVDDFRIYDYVLSANEVSGLYYGTDPTTQNKYIIRSLNTYNDGYDSQNTTSAILYTGNELTSPKQPTYHKLNTQNLNRLLLQVSNDIDTNKPYNGWKPSIEFGCVLHIVDNEDNNI